MFSLPAMEDGKTQRIEEEAMPVDDEIERALADCEVELARHPGFDAHVKRAHLLERMGRWEEAAGSYADAARLKPDRADIFFRMGTCLARLGLHPAAVQAYDRALGRNRRHADARIAASASLHALGRIGEALRLLEDDSVSDLPAALGNRAELMMEQGRLEEALALLRSDETRLRHHPGMHSNLIRAMIYDPDVTGGDLLAEAQRWNRWHAVGSPPAPGTFPNDPQPDRPLRVGFVGTRMCRHNTATHLLQLLRAHDRKEWKVTLYSAGTVHDEMTAALKENADAWREIALLDDPTAAHLIRSDRIDLLVDLNEHANGGRLTLFTHKPAPVQLHWYGNAVTTGVAAIDYRISDDVAEPPGDADACSAETILRLPTGYYCYAPPPGAVEPIADPPCRAHGRVTFGAIHHLAKLNPRVLACWRAILERVPNADLLLGRAVMADWDTSERVTDCLRKAGIDPSRVRFCGDARHISSLAVFNEMDLVLDSFPFNGDATTTDALWMGVPVVTLMGNRLSARRAASQLRRIGAEEWVTENEAAYIALAVSLANDSARLAHVRASLPDRVRRSPLCDAPAVARAMAVAFREAWVEGYVRPR